MMQFFGVWDANHLGHFVHSPSGRHQYQEAIIQPEYLDGVFPPNMKGEPETIMSYVILGERRVIAMWDRTADSRPKSNAAFISDQPLLFEAMIKEAINLFPTVTRRLKAFAELERLGLADFKAS